MQQKQQAIELLRAKYKAMESKLLIEDKNIMDHTKKQQKTAKLYAKLQVKAEIQDQDDEYICTCQDLEEAQNEHIQELKLKYLRELHLP
ncbi:hypothetical protein GH733_005871 [Mirounga leonina]|nr:hypothetical protein GH733_005871 [Mirounga leonina]